MKKFHHFPKFNDQRGVTAVFVAICMLMLLGFVALSVDIAHLAVARNELQNAADAGALAGARYLYLDDGSGVNPGCDDIARNAAIANASENTPVEVYMDNTPADVERGHWSFAQRKFTPNNSTAAITIANYTEAQLDVNDDFINAIRVKTHRLGKPSPEGTPIASFFARIFGYDEFQGSGEAIAYIGYAGTLEPYTVDFPIAICLQSLLGWGEPDPDDPLTCSIGRMINSGSNTETHETGGWTDFNQDNPCAGGTNANTMKNLISNSSCGSNGANPVAIILGGDIATIGGETSAFPLLYDCWNGTDEPWEITLPVIDCPGNNVTTCQEAVGAVTINVIWITNLNDPLFKEVPSDHYTFQSSTTDGELRWGEFVEHFNLKNIAENDTYVPAPYAKKSIYFLPSCTAHEPSGVTGGRNFGVLARIPVLVD